jgi:hypothetical protein
LNLLIGCFVGALDNAFLCFVGIEVGTLVGHNVGLDDGGLDREFIDFPLVGLK